MGAWAWMEIEPDDGGLLGFILGNMAYPFVFFATVWMCVSHESLQNVIPGHPILSFLILACGAMVLTFLFLQLSLIGPAFSAFCCMFILGLVYVTIVAAIGPDSVQFFILLTVIFSAISLPLCLMNLSSRGEIRIPWLSCIVAGILNAHTAAFYVLIIRSAWEVSSFPKGDIVIEDKILYNSYLGDLVGSPNGFSSVSGAVMFYIFFSAICIGAFVLTIIYRKKLAAC